MSELKDEEISERIRQRVAELNLLIKSAEDIGLAVGIEINRNGYGSSDQGRIWLMHITRDFLSGGKD